MCKMFDVWPLMVTLPRDLQTCASSSLIMMDVCFKKPRYQQEFIEDKLYCTQVQTLISKCDLDLSCAHLILSKTHRPIMLNVYQINLKTIHKGELVIKFFFTFPFSQVYFCIYFCQHFCYDTDSWILWTLSVVALEVHITDRYTPLQRLLITDSLTTDWSNNSHRRPMTSGLVQFTLTLGWRQTIIILS